MGKKKQVEVPPPAVEPPPGDEVIVTPLEAPLTAPGQTGSAPLTKPQRRDERRWQQ